MNETTPTKPAKAKPAKKFEIVKVGNSTFKIYIRQRLTTIGKFRTIYTYADKSTGKRVLKSFSTLEAATSAATKDAAKDASGRLTVANMKDADAASYARSLQILKPTGLSLELAASIVAKCFEILGGDDMIESARHFARHKPNSVTRRAVAEVVVELVKVKAARGLSADYTHDLRQRLTRFAVAFGANPATITDPEAKDESGNDTRNRGVDVSTITTAEVQGFLDRLKLGTQSVKNFRTVLHTLFEFAEARGYVFKGSNPVVATETVKVRNGAIQIFNADEIAALLKAASPDFRPLIALGAFAGLRSAEAERIEWKDIDLAGGFITVAADKAKTNTRRLVPILPNLAQWLAPYANRTGKVWQASPNHLQDARASCVKASGVKWKANGARHSFASYRLAATQSAAQVSLEMGNSPAVVFKHYRELVKPPQAAAWFAVSPEQPANVTTLPAALAV